MLRQEKVSLVAMTLTSMKGVLRDDKSQLHFCLSEETFDRISIYPRAKAGSVIKRAHGGALIYIGPLIADL